MNEDHHPVGRPLGENRIEAWLHVPTGNVFKDGDCQALIKRWHKQFPDIPADEMEADFVPLVGGKALLDRIEELEGAVRDIAEATDPDNPDSYRCDDREGCLDTVNAIAKALSGEKP